MSIEIVVQNFSPIEAGSEPARRVIHVIGAESIQAFGEFIDRALNCWDEAPKELKELGDMWTHGYVTQNHRRQRISAQNADYGDARYMLALDKVRDEVGLGRFAELMHGERIELNELVKKYL